MTGLSLRHCLALTLTFAAASAQAEEPLVIGALGDSISAGFNAQRFGDNRDLSWSTGSNALVNSHAQRLAALRNRPVTAYNEAIAGSVSVDLERQVGRLMRHAPDYVTVTIGANDVCGWSSDHLPQLLAFQQKVRTQVARMIEGKPTVKIFLAPIPDMYNLWEVSVGRSSCQSKWDMTGLCAPLLSSSSTEEDRLAFVERWKDANDAIEEVAGEFHENVLHDPRLGGTRFNWEHVSGMDCFHPSVAGQALLAEKAWLLTEDFLP